MSALTTLYCGKEEFGSMESVNALATLKGAHKMLNYTFHRLFWLPVDAARAGAGVATGLAYMGACGYARAVVSVGSDICNLNVFTPLDNTYEGVTLLFSRSPHLEDRYEGLKVEVEQKGFQLSQLSEDTSDGYTLVVHNIKKADLRADAPVVFLQHGLKGCSADWTIGGLAYQLAGRGYNVFLGNFRGNYFSCQHNTHSRDSSRYWDFSFEEHGSVDLPTMLSAVLRQTGATKLSYVGHSMGVTSFFIMMHKHGREWARKVEKCIALAPVAHINNMTGFPSHFVPAVPLVVDALNLVGLGHFDSTKLNRVLPAPIYNLLGTATAYAIGYHEMDPRVMKNVFKFNPNPTSTETLRHFLDCRKDRRFRGRHSRSRSQSADRAANANANNNADNANSNDRTSNDNRDFDVFELTRTSCPVRIFYSDDDWVAGGHDCRLIASRLPNCLSVEEVKGEGTKMGQTFGHQDFVWARGSAAGLLRKVLEDFPEQS